MKIIVDTREQSCNHITGYFDAKQIPYEFRGLKSGDYAVELDGTVQPIIIERKNSLDEICGNFTRGRRRFTNEFTRVDAAKFLLIEDANWDAVYQGKYGSKMNPHALFGSILAFEFRYNLHIHFVGKKYMGPMIFNIFYYYLQSCGENQKQPQERVVKNV